MPSPLNMMHLATLIRRNTVYISTRMIEFCCLSQCLSSTTAFSYAAQYIARYEEQVIGIQWSNVKDDPLFDDGFSFQWCCIMILIDAVIYFILGWYVRNVKPGKFYRIILVICLCEVIFSHITIFNAMVVCHFPTQ